MNPSEFCESCCCAHLSALDKMAIYPLELFLSLSCDQWTVLQRLQIHEMNYGNILSMSNVNNEEEVKKMDIFFTILTLMNVLLNRKRRKLYEKQKFRKWDMKQYEIIKLLLTLSGVIFSISGMYHESYVVCYFEYNATKDRFLLLKWYV